MLRRLRSLGCFRRNSRARDRPQNTGGLGERREEFPFEYLVADLKRRIVDFLPVSDAMRVCLTSRTIRQDLGLVAQPAFRILEANYWRGDVESLNTPRIATIVPIFDGRRTQSITMQCQWREQGGGGKKGSKLYIVAHEQGDDDFCMPSGTVVAESDYASRSTTTLSLSFRPQPGKVYYLWYQVGSGPGQQLYISDILVYAVVFERGEL